MAADFVHLHVHSEYSMLDGASRVGQLVKHVADQDMPGVALTDHGVMFGIAEFLGAANKVGINGIAGCELYLAPESRFDRTTTVPGKTGTPYYHLTALAENNVGYKNLMKLSSLAYSEGYWRKPRVDRELLERYREGVIILSGCLGGEINQMLLNNNEAGAKETMAWYRDVFGDRYFVELQDHGIPEQDETNPKLIAMAKDLTIPLVVTNDSHYTYQSDYDAHDGLLCIQTNSLKSETNRFKFHNNQFYVKSAEEMKALFPDLPETWKNTLEINERCKVTLGYGERHLPKFHCPDGMSEKDYLRHKVTIGALERYGAESGVTSYEALPDEVKERLEFELGVIENMGFSAYFLIVSDLIDFARANGIRVGPGRGSAAGCAVSYCTGITNLDPLAHGLLFERFLNPERVSMPDIDMDFDERRRGDMITYTANKYGTDHVAQIVTYQTIKAKQAIKDAARVLGMPYAFGDKLVKMFPTGDINITLKDAIEQSGELKEEEASSPDARRVLGLARGLEGLRRQHSIHAAGVVIADEPITDVVPTLKVKGEGETVTQYDGGQIEALGLLKMDFLGLRNLTVISDAVEHIKNTTGEDIDLDELDLKDPLTYTMLTRGDTDGVFQLESAGYKALCRSMKPDRFEDITALGALYRPGPMSADLHNEYARRKNGLSPVSFAHQDLSEILGESYGLLIYQEQVQLIAQKIAGFTLGQADGIRKAIGKKLLDKMAEIKDSFLEGTVNNGYELALGEKLWNEIEGFAKYAFNKSHSAAYGVVTYQTAWLKANYPVQYMAALLTSVKNNKDKLPAALYSTKTMGIEVLVPDINESLVNFSPVGDGSTKQIRFGLSAVRNVGEYVCEQIIKERNTNGPFIDIYDFASRVDTGVLNKRLVESLVRAGAFESLGHPRKGLAMVVDQIVDGALATRKREDQGEYSLFDMFDEAEIADEDTSANRVEIPDTEYDRADKLVAEKEMLGLFVSDHPLKGYERVLEPLSTAPIPQLIDEATHRYENGTTTEEHTGGRNRFQGTEVTIAGLLSGVTKRFTKKGDSYVIGQIEDFGGRLDVTFFPQAYNRYADLLHDDAIVVINGRLKDEDPPQVIVDTVSAPDLSAVGAAPLVLRLHPGQCVPELLGRLKEILETFPGATKVNLILDDHRGRATTLYLPAQLRIERSTALVSELKALLGREAVA